MITTYTKRIIAFFVILYIVGMTLINYHNQVLLYLFPEKIWIHRVNSVDKLKEVSDRFQGVELDVVFIQGKNMFDVNHPPAQSNNLSLLEYLSSIKLTSKNKFWLDFKNLSDDNMKSSCLKLDSLCNLFMLNREQFIVESSSHPKYLSLFKMKGFKTSYYLYGTLDKLRLQKIKNVLSSNKTQYISSDKRNYRILKEQFPNEKILTWSYGFSTRKTINPYYLYINLKSMYLKFKMLSEGNVSVVLFGYSSKGGNR